MSYVIVFWLNCWSTLLKLSFGQAQKCGRVKQVNGIPLPSDNWISNNNVFI
jgi:hypothetical protein